MRSLNHSKKCSGCKNACTA